MSTAHYINSARLIVESARQEKVLGLPPGAGKVRPPLVTCRELELSASAATLFAEGQVEDRGVGREMAGEV